MKRIYISTLLILLATMCFAQTGKTDKDLLQSVTFEKPEFGERTVTYGFTKGKKTYNPIYHILSAAMYMYQTKISPQLSRECAYETSCSAYSKNLIKEYGILKGVFCSSDRLTRCNRVSLRDKPSYYFETPSGKIKEGLDRYSNKKAE